MYQFIEILCTIISLPFLYTPKTSVIQSVSPQRRKMKKKMTVPFR